MSSSSEYYYYYYYCASTAALLVLLPVVLLLLLLLLLILLVCMLIESKQSYHQAVKPLSLPLYLSHSLCRMRAGPYNDAQPFLRAEPADVCRRSWPLHLPDNGYFTDAVDEKLLNFLG